MDIKTKAVLEKLFRAYNRRATDQALENYIEFTCDYSFHAIREAVKRHIEIGGTMPNPADIRNTCMSVIGPSVQRCDICNGAGYKSKSGEKDKYGFDYLKSVVRCSCQTEISPSVKLTDQEAIKAHSLGRILARTIALKSLSDEMNVVRWRSFWWDKDDGEAKWALLGSKIDNLEVLGEATEFVEKSKPDDCAFYAFDVAKDAIRNGKKILRQRQEVGKRSSQPFR